jgi:hypothetical protein
MRKAAPPNVDPAHGRDTPYPVDHDPAEVRGWNWRGGPLRPLLVAFLALVLVGMVLWGIEKEAAEIDFQLLVTTLRATPAASVAAALAATALSYLALIGYDVSALHYARAYAPLRTILLASFSGFAIGNAVGLGAFSGGAVRYRRARYHRCSKHDPAGQRGEPLARRLTPANACDRGNHSDHSQRISDLLRTAPNTLATRRDRHRCARRHAGADPGSTHGDRRARRRGHALGAAALSGN